MLLCLSHKVQVSLAYSRVGFTVPLITLSLVALFNSLHSITSFLKAPITLDAAPVLCPASASHDPSSSSMAHRCFNSTPFFVMFHVTPPLFTTIAFVFLSSSTSIFLSAFSSPSVTSIRSPAHWRSPTVPVSSLTQPPISALPPSQCCP